MAETISRKSVIYDILYDFKKGNVSAAEAEKKIKGVEKSIGSFEKVAKQAATAFAGLFAIQRIAQFTQESIKLAAAAEGVRAAFNRLNRPNLLSNLRKATRNTVTDLKLMEASVRAENFKIPLERLAGFFEFAQKRARATGESVDYLVESIINGIGRKSTLVLDNLGISAVQLQEELKKTGDFGQAAANIIEREMKKAGDAGETAADKMEQFMVAIENLKLQIGELLLPAFTESLGDLTKVLNKLGDETESTTKKIANLISYFAIGDNPISAWFKRVTGISKFTSQIEKTSDGIQELKNRARELGVDYHGLVDPLGKLTQAGEDFVLNNRIVIEGLEDTKIAADATAKSYINLAAVISQFNSTVDDSINEKIILNINALNQQIDFFEKKVAETDISTKSGREQITLYQREIAKLKKQIEDILEPYKDLQKAINDFSKNVQDETKLIIENKNAIFDLTDAYKKYLEIVNNPPSVPKQEKKLEKDQELRDEINKETIDGARQTFATIKEITDAQYSYELNALNNKLANQQISQEEYNRQVQQLNKQKAENDLAYTITEIAINSGLAIAKAVAQAQDVGFPAAIPATIAAIASVLAGIGQAYAAVKQVQSFAEGTEFLERGKNKAGKDTIPIMANEGEAIIPTDRNLEEPGLAKAWIDGDLDRYIYRNYVMPELMKSTGKKNGEKDYTEKFYRQYLATQEQTSKQVSLLKSIDSKLKSGSDYRSRYGRA